MRTEKFRRSPFALLLTALLLLTIVLAAAPAAYGEETAAPAADDAAPGPEAFRLWTGILSISIFTGRLSCGSSVTGMMIISGTG